MAVKTWSTPVSGEETLPVPCTLCGTAQTLPRFNCGGFAYVRCVRCGLVRINPQPSPASIAARYGPGHGKEYLAYEQANEAAFLRLQELALADAGFFELERILLAAANNGPAGSAGVPAAAVTASAGNEPAPGARAPAVLDIGCATGALLAGLKNRGWAVQGVELSEQQAAYCRSRGLDVAAGTVEQRRFPGGRFDAALASHLIEHLNDPGSFVREVHRILKPGGRFYVTTPNIAGFQARLFGSRWRSAIFDHLYLFSVKTLRSLLETCFSGKEPGFTVERVRTWGGLAAGTAPRPVKTLFDRAAKRFGFGDVMILRAVKSAV
ncbi:MAG: class I SAM-dependent methyltransferase [Spirochaetaceae bacterium]|jgi:2-polyprenyl-3-methyl-5-hydroxy-6-metoxy-1,4-benzoquinol methylase|nr:class I SAM-dependent methyltransferase [Spirochaetaceae bacterium]